jgi:hypothetical protein
MFSSKHYINIFSLAAIGLTGIIFIFKFAVLYREMQFLIAVIYFILLTTAALLLDKQLSGIKSLNKKTFDSFFIIVVTAVIFIIIFSSETARTVEAEVWLANLFNGKFPYDRSGYSFALPVLYFLAALFYLAGNTSLVSAAGFIIFSIIVRFYSASNKEKFIRIFLLIGSPLILFSIMQAGIIFLVSVLLILLFHLSPKKIDPSKVNFSFIFLGTCFGLILATYIELIFPISIFLLFHFRNNLLKAMLFSFIVISTFLLTISPFIMINKELFYEHTFFTSGIFNSALSIPLFLLYLFFLIAAGWLTADLQETFFVSSIALSLPSIISFADKLVTSGFYTSDVYLFDLKYLIISVPLFAASIKDYKVDRFLGKVNIEE